jgi:hypothetical protein
MYPGSYTFTNAVVIEHNDLWIQGLGGGLDDHLGKATTLKRNPGSNPFFALKPVNGNEDLYGFHLSDLALEGQISPTADTANMVDSSAFEGTTYAVNKATFEFVGVKNLAASVSGIKLCNPDNGVYVGHISGGGGIGMSDTLGKLIHLKGCGRTSAGGNTLIEDIDDADMKSNSSAAVFIERGSSSLNRIDIRHVHAYGNSQGTAFNATAVVIKQNGISYTLQDIRGEFVRLISANGAFGGQLEDVTIIDSWGTDTRTTIPSTNKIMIDLGADTRNVLITGHTRIEGASSNKVDMAIRNNNTSPPYNWLDFDNLHLVNYNTAIGGNGITKIKTHTNLKGTFDLYPANVKTVSVAHTLPITPAKQDCSVTVLENPSLNADDFKIDWIKITNTDPTYVTVKVKVGTASANTGAKADLGIVCNG